MSFTRHMGKKSKRGGYRPPGGSNAQPGAESRWRPPASPEGGLPVSLTPPGCHVRRLPLVQDDAAIERAMTKLDLPFDGPRPGEQPHVARARREKNCARLRKEEQRRARLRMTLKRKREKEDAGAEEEAAARDAGVRAAAA